MVESSVPPLAFYLPPLDIFSSSNKCRKSIIGTTRFAWSWSSLTIESKAWRRQRTLLPGLMDLLPESSSPGQEGDKNVQKNFGNKACICTWPSSWRGCQWRPTPRYSCSPSRMRTGLVWYDEECERIFGGRVGWSRKRAGFVVATGRLGCISWTKESEGRGWWIQAAWWTFEWFLCIRATLKIRFTFCVIFGLNKWIEKDNAYLFIW